MISTYIWNSPLSLPPSSRSPCTKSTPLPPHLQSHQIVTLRQGPASACAQQQQQQPKMGTANLYHQERLKLHIEGQSSLV